MKKEAHHMDDNGNIWNFRDSAGPAALPLTVEHAGAASLMPPVAVGADLGAHHDSIAHEINLMHDHAMAVSLHPNLRLVITRSLHGDAEIANNLCIVVGTVTREYWPNRPNRHKSSAAPTQNDARTVRTPLGTTETLLRLEVQEVLGDGTGAALTSYSIPLNVNARLAASDVFADGQRIAICGPLRLERTYDPRFAADDLDPGLPAWKLRPDVITMQPLPDDADIPDGSWVQLEGEVEDEPIVRLRPIGPLATISFASVRLRCRTPLRGGFSGSQARFQSSVIVPLEVPLDGGLAHAGALLKRGNQVRIEGRLTSYQMRRAPEVSETAPARRKESAALLRDALARTEARVRSAGGDDRRVRAAKQQLLTGTQLTVSVGYVELRHGTELTDDQIAELIASRPRRVRTPRTGERSLEPEPDSDRITTALDTATSSKLGGDGVRVDASADMPLADDAAALKRERPRRRGRALGTGRGSGDGRR
jgi:hypothetical protein